MNTEPSNHEVPGIELNLPLVAPRRDLVAAAIQQRRAKTGVSWRVFAASMATVLLLFGVYLYVPGKSSAPVVTVTSAASTAEINHRAARLAQRLDRWSARPGFKSPSTLTVDQRLKRVEMRLEAFKRKAPIRGPERLTNPKYPATRRG